MKKINHRLIQEDFEFYFNKYEHEKYPKDIYINFRNSFSNVNPTQQQIRNAINWKFGNLNKKNSPTSHKELIKEIIDWWPLFQLSNERLSILDTFNWWKMKLANGGRKRFITIAFITHLVHHKKNLPIIDQHNFRAMNYLSGNLQSKKYPSCWYDIEKLTEFITEISKVNKKKRDAIDKYLMMFGKAIKKNKLICT